MAPAGAAVENSINSAATSGRTDFLIGSPHHTGRPRGHTGFSMYAAVRALRTLLEAPRRHVARVHLAAPAARLPAVALDELLEPLQVTGDSEVHDLEQVAGLLDHALRLVVQ